MDYEYGEVGCIREEMFVVSGCISRPTQLWLLICLSGVVSLCCSIVRLVVIPNDGLAGHCISVCVRV